MKLPHVESDEHAVLALGYMKAALEVQGVVLPGPGEWLDMWTMGLDSNRTEGDDDPILKMLRQGAQVSQARKTRPVEAAPEDNVDDAEEPEDGELDPADSPETRKRMQRERKLYTGPKPDIPQTPRPQGLDEEQPWDADAGSKNIIQLVKCSVTGCDNEIPITKELSVCHEHEPQAGDASGVEVD
jgi:hypothetical protein